MIIPELSYTEGESPGQAGTTGWAQAALNLLFGKVPCRRVGRMETVQQGVLLRSLLFPPPEYPYIKNQIVNVKLLNK
jgi:hypothetical protein